MAAEQGGVNAATRKHFRLETNFDWCDPVIVQPWA
jgi:hypothetical protein